MLILCPNCSTSYQVNPEAIGPEGRLVQCTHCQSTWFAGGPEPGPDTPISAENVFKPVGWFSPPDVEEWRTADQTGGETLVPVDGDDQLIESAELAPEGDSIAPTEDAAAQDDVLEPPQPMSEQSVAVIDTPPLAPPFEQAAPDEPSDEDLDAEVIETFAARRRRLQSRRGKHRRSSGWTAVILVLIACNAAALGGRGEIVRTLPQTASLFAAIGLPVNLRQLEFEHVKISKDAQDGVLIVQGAIVNTAAKATEVPRLRITARNATGQDIYTWTARASRSVLGPGEQVKFTSRLTCAAAGRQRHDRALRQGARRRRGARKTRRMAKVLIAEDDETVRALVVRALSEDGHALTTVADGAEALDALNRNGKFDLLLTDVKMPVMDGIALALAAGRDHPDVAIMLMTGYADQRERAHELDALVHDVIAKPFTLSQIQVAVKEALLPRR